MNLNKNELYIANADVDFYPLGLGNSQLVSPSGKYVLVKKSSFDWMSNDELLPYVYYTYGESQSDSFDRDHWFIGRGSIDKNFYIYYSGEKEGDHTNPTELYAVGNGNFFESDIYFPTGWRQPNSSEDFKILINDSTYQRFSFLTKKADLTYKVTGDIDIFYKTYIEEFEDVDTNDGWKINIQDEGEFVYFLSNNGDVEDYTKVQTRFSDSNSFQISRFYAESDFGLNYDQPIYFYVRKGIHEDPYSTKAFSTKQYDIPDFQSYEAKQDPPFIEPSNTPTNTITPTQTPTNTLTPTITPTISPSSSEGAPTPTLTPTITKTPSITPTCSLSPAPENYDVKNFFTIVKLGQDIKPDASVTPTTSITPTITPTISKTPSVTPSITPTSSNIPRATRLFASNTFKNFDDEVFDDSSQILYGDKIYVLSDKSRGIYVPKISFPNSNYDGNFAPIGEILTVKRSPYGASSPFLENAAGETTYYPELFGGLGRGDIWEKLTELGYDFYTRPYYFTVDECNDDSYYSEDGFICSAGHYYIAYTSPSKHNFSRPELHSKVTYRGFDLFLNPNNVFARSSPPKRSLSYYNLDPSATPTPTTTPTVTPTVTFTPSVTITPTITPTPTDASVGWRLRKVVKEQSSSTVRNLLQGYDVAINENGDTFAFSAMKDPLNIGSVTAYSLTGESSAIKGNKIIAEAADFDFGTCIDINSDGSILAIGSRGEDDLVNKNYNIGSARVYEFIDQSNSWEQVGETIFGSGFNTSADLIVGKKGTVAINGAGDILAVGYSSQNTGINPRVNIYQKTEITPNNYEWNIIGQPITGSGKFASKIDINGDGYRIAISSEDDQINNLNNIQNNFISGESRVSVFDYDQNSNQWNKAFEDIYETGHSIGSSISLNSDGNIIAIGSRSFTSGSQNHIGKVDVYDIDQNPVKIGSSITGSVENEQFGYNVKINNSGDILTVASPMFGNASNSVAANGGIGIVRVYQNINESWQEVYYSVSGKENFEKLGFSLDSSFNGSVAKFIEGSPYSSIGESDGFKDNYFKTDRNNLSRVKLYEFYAPEPSLTPTNTLTPTPTTTPTSTITVTPTNSPTPSVTPTVTPTQGLSATPTPTITSTITPTSTMTITPTKLPACLPEYNCGTVEDINYIASSIETKIYKFFDTATQSVVSGYISGSERDINNNCSYVMKNGSQSYTKSESEITGVNQAYDFTTTFYGISTTGSDCSHLNPNSPSGYEFLVVTGVGIDCDDIQYQYTGYWYGTQNAKPTGIT